MTRSEVFKLISLVVTAFSICFEMAFIAVNFMIPAAVCLLVGLIVSVLFCILAEMEDGNGKD